MTSPSHLWPSLDALKGYLDTWAQYAYSLEAQVQTLEAMSRRQEDALSAEIVRLTKEVADCAAPLEQQIVGLQLRISDLEHQNTQLITDRDDSIKRLAKLLEIPPTPRMTLQDLVGKAMSLVDHTKAMFRERL